MMNFTISDAETVQLSGDVHATKRDIVSSGVRAPTLISYEQPETPVLPSLSSRPFEDALGTIPASSGRTTDSQFTPPKGAHRIGSYIVSAEDECVGRRRASSTFNPSAGFLDCFIVNARDAQRQVALRVHLDEPDWLPSVVDTLVVGHWAYFFSVPTYGSLLDEFGSDCARGMDETRVADLFGQIVDIVTYCHERGVVLRDLTLRCFSFEDEARTTIKLLSVEHAELSEVRDDRFACRFYACPEMFSTSPSDPTVVNPYSAKGADVWSLGVIFYALLVGCYPFFDNAQTRDICTVIKSSRLRLPRHVTSCATRLLLGMLERNPKKRLTAAALSHHPFFKQRRPAWVLNMLAENRSAADDQCVPFLSEDNAPCLLW